MALRESCLTGYVLKHRLVVFGLEMARMDSGLDSPRNILHDPVAAGTFFGLLPKAISLSGH